LSERRKYRFIKRIKTLRKQTDIKIALRIDLIKELKDSEFTEYN
jgi:hypothetical protein